ncbi:hypothetical protein HK096_010747 [Nowakowskiella sp. JEL0078]|nr:hypothetical protein HK096_010747 [Nowakowskiella sp. JEL0078]
MSKLSSQRRRVYSSYRGNWSENESEGSASSSPPSDQNRSYDGKVDYSYVEEIRSVTNQFASSGIMDLEEPDERPWGESPESGNLNEQRDRNFFLKNSEIWNGSISKKNSVGKLNRFDPAFTPKLRDFWLHDDRFAPEVGGMGGFRSDRIKQDKVRERFQEKDFKNQRDDRESGNKPIHGDTHGLRGVRSKGFSSARAGFSGRGTRETLVNSSPGSFLADSRKREIRTEMEGSDPTSNKWVHDKFEEIQKNGKNSIPDFDRRKSWAPASQPLRERPQRTPYSLEKKKSTPIMQYSSRETSLDRNSPDSTHSTLYRRSSQSHSQKDLTREFNYATFQTEEANFNIRQTSNSSRGSNSIRGRFESISKRGGNGQLNTSQKSQPFFQNEFKTEWNQANEYTQKYTQSKTNTSINTNDESTPTQSKPNKRYLSTKLTNETSSSTQISEKPLAISNNSTSDINLKDSNFLKKVINAPEFQPSITSAPQYGIDPTLNLNPPTAFIPPFTSQTRQIIQPFLTSSGHLILMTENGYILPPTAPEYLEQFQRTQLYFPYPQYTSMEYYDSYGTSGFYEGPSVDKLIEMHDNKEFFFSVPVREQQMDEELWVTDGVPDWESLKQYEVDYDAIEKGFVGERWKEKDDEWDSDGSDIDVILER